MILAGLPAVQGAEPADPIGQAFARLYNFDFPGAHTILDRHTGSHPEDPMGYSARAAVDLFYELDRLSVLEGEFLTDDERLTDKKRLPVDPRVRARFFRSVGTAQSKAQATLSRNPQQAEALYALCMSYGVTGDYAALVERRQIQSLSFNKQSNSCAQRLLAAHPDAYDAYVTTGFTEYLAGSLPFFVKWFVKFDNVQGSKPKAIADLQLAARSGNYLRPFAKILLAILYLREKNPDESARMLQSFAQEYPENPLVRRELAKLTLKNGQGPLGQK
jgi:predicted Zn-dependent protease